MLKPNEGLTRGLPRRETSDDTSPQSSTSTRHLKIQRNLYDKLHETPGKLHQTQAQEPRPGTGVPFANPKMASLFIPAKRTAAASLRVIQSCIPSQQKGPLLGVALGNHIKVESCVLRLVSSTEKAHGIHKYLEAASTWRNDNGVPIINSI